MSYIKPGAQSVLDPELPEGEEDEALREVRLVAWK